jgi:hypothetical protein
LDLAGVEGGLLLGLASSDLRHVSASPGSVQTFDQTYQGEPDHVL